MCITGFCPQSQTQEIGDCTHQAGGGPIQSRTLFGSMPAAISECNPYAKRTRSHNLLILIILFSLALKISSQIQLKLNSLQPRLKYLKSEFPPWPRNRKGVDNARVNRMYRKTHRVTQRIHAFCGWEKPEILCHGVLPSPDC